MTINRAIADTVHVTISAATNVNINSTITNIKNGSDLSVTAGTNINVSNQIDGRSGTAAGGTVTMTAGNNIALTESIATNDGAVSLTATNGTLTLPIGVESYSNNGTPNGAPPPGYTDDIWTPMQWVVSSGNAPITVSTGGNFSLTSPLVTSGALSITSTSGDVTIKAPITNATGAVTITAGDALNIHHQVKSNDQDITLNAGAGGITITHAPDPITGLPILGNIIDYDFTNTRRSLRMPT